MGKRHSGDKIPFKMSFRLTLSILRVTLTDLTLSNARRFYSSMGDSSGMKKKGKERKGTLFKCLVVLALEH